MNKQIHLRVICFFVAVLFLCSTQCVLANESDSKPNIVFIFADDQCFSAVHRLGCDEIETPNLDKLVDRGVTFTHAYNQGSWSGAVCVASRGMLNTGRFLWHANRACDQAEKERAAGRLWSEYLKKADYDTYMAGKWHVDKVDPHRAFDFVKNVRPGMPNQTPEGYNRPIEGKPDRWSPYDPKFGGYWKGGKHWSEVLGDDATRFIKQASKNEKPFFMYLAFNAPHDPRQSPKFYVDKYPYEKIKIPENFLPQYPYKDDIECGKDLRDERLAPFPRTEYSVQVNRQEYYAIITHMDAQIGRILDAIEKSGKADNTYIFFTADHGLAVGQHGLMGKQNLFDHSVRVPFIVVGPNVPKGKKIDGGIYLQDVMPTSLDLAGVEMPEQIQFKSVMPIIEGKRKCNYDAIYGAYRSVQRAVTQGDYKLILYPKIKKVLLFNLKQDPWEMNNLAENPENDPIIKKLFKAILELQKETGDSLDLKRIYPNLL